jgi:hypothetical protein
MQIIDFAQWRDARRLKSPTIQTFCAFDPTTCQILDEAKT